MSKRKKEKKSRTLLLIVLLVLAYFAYNFYKDYMSRIEVEEEKANISEYFIYGNHLNLFGTLQLEDTNYKDIYLCLYDKEDKDIKIKTSIDGNKISFNTSTTINEGIYLDNIARGTYYMFIKVVYSEKEKDINKYYALENNTKYKDNIYYTLSKYNNKILINSNNDYSTLSLKIKQNDDKDIYDITLDPGHGGMDSGAVNGKYMESNFTMSITKKIEKILKDNNIKVKLTHDEKELTKNDIMDEYNKGGRAVIPNEVNSKYTFSIHINKNDSSKVNGIEVYTPKNINYDLAESIVNELVNKTELNYSTNKLYKEKNGIYTHTFTENEINSANENHRAKNRKPYDITENSNYLYMIRETGGYMTGAYVDNRNEKIGENPYYNSNIGNESYLLELGYISNANDLNTLNNSENDIAKAVAEMIIKELNKEV